MLFDTMKPFIIIKIFIGSSFTVILLLMAIRRVIQPSFEKSKNAFPYFLFSLSALFMQLSILVTAPDPTIYNTMYQCILFTLLLCIVTFSLSCINRPNTMLFRKNFKYSYDEILYNLDDSIFVFDLYHKLIMKNTSTNDLFSKDTYTFDELLQLSKITDTTKIPSSIITELSLQSHYLVMHLSQLYGHEQQQIGYLILFHDVTSEHILMEELEQQHNEISNIHKTLLNEVQVEEALFMQQERNSFAIRLQKEILDKISLLQSNLLEQQFSQEENQSHQYLNDLTNRLREILKDVRQMVHSSHKSNEI